MNDWFAADRPLIIGHRGASAAAPENTLAAFYLAVQEGADGIEFDVQLSADGVPVIIHDDTVDRTTNGAGRVTAMTLARLQALDAGSGERITTLDELFDRFGRSLLYNLEIKGFRLRGYGLEAAITDRIRVHGLESRLLVSSFNPFSLRRARACLPAQTPVALLRQIGLQNYAYLLARGPAEHPAASLVDERYMDGARRSGRRIHAWTVDDPAEGRRLLDLGVHGLITNRPAFLRDSLADCLPA